MELALNLEHGDRAAKKRPGISREPGVAKGAEIGLVQSAQRGSRSAFTELHQRYAPMVHAILMSRAPASEIDDLLQDVFLQAFRRITGLRDPATFGGWLATIARNRAIDHHRRKKAVVSLPDDVAAAGASASRNAEAEEALEAIRALPDAYCETLMMRLVEGMTGPEIAAATGLTPGSVRVNLHRGMKLLRSKLEGEADER